MNMNFKQTLLTAALVVSSAAAIAAPSFSIIGGTQTSFVAFNPTGSLPGGYTDSLGISGSFNKGATVNTNNYSNVTFTFVGKEAGFNNVFYYNGGFVFNNTATPGATSVTFTNVAAGALNFAFYSAGPSGAYQGSFGNGSDRVGAMKNGSDKIALLFNDKGGDLDYDDMVVTAQVTAVPEPETYAMMLAGLGLMGTIARRRNKAKAA